MKLARISDIVVDVDLITSIEPVDGKTSKINFRSGAPSVIIHQKIQNVITCINAYRKIYG